MLPMPVRDENIFILGSCGPAVSKEGVEKGLSSKNGSFRLG